MWRETSRGAEIAVIHRARYGDWCLPKGKTEKGEDWQETAVREVGEEVGCNAIITGFAGTTHYDVQNTPKIVFFWNMTPEGSYSFKPSEEVDKVEWLSPCKAIRKLDHAEERDLLKAVYRTRERADFFTELQNSSLGKTNPFTDFLKSRRYRRLSASLCAYGFELEQRVDEQCRNMENPDLSWVKPAAGCLSHARKALEKRRYDEGWRCFTAARRMAVLSLGDEELKARADALRLEADQKLSAWRQEAIKKLLGEDEDEHKRPNDVPKDERAKRSRRQLLSYALLIRDEHFNNSYYKIGLLQEQLKNIFFILGIIILVFFYFGDDLLPQGSAIRAGNNPITEIAPVAGKSVSTNLAVQPAGDAVGGGSTGQGDQDMLRVVILFGLLGGALSAARSISRTPAATRIPEQIATISITLFRILIGAASAIPVYILVRSGILDKVFSFQTVSPTSIYFISFLAGFSEKFFINIVSAVNLQKK